uniref:PRE_C2HC domain-containing protein n=1 Tax=Haemonchus contortus TaxID=6289 RepID=A0A7I4Z5H6_HAECO
MANECRESTSPRKTSGSISSDFAPPVLNSPVEYERRKSVIIAGVAERPDSNLMIRLQHDTHCVSMILEFLGIECSPLSIYRLGNINKRSPRLLKVVLPARKFQVQLLRNASLLRFFHIKGVFIKASLTKEERAMHRQSRISSVPQGNSLSQFTRSNQNVIASNSFSQVQPCSTQSLN